MIEKTLAQVEGEFVRALEAIQPPNAIDAPQRVALCVFAAAMFARTNLVGASIERSFRSLHEKVVDLEEAHDVEANLSLQTERMAEYAHHFLIGNALSVIPPLLYEMSLSLLTTDDGLGFITSDAPCVWFNPEAYKWPPFYRNPGLAQEHIEVTLPLSPRLLLLFTHHRVREGFIPLPAAQTDEINRRTRAHADKWFVSWTGETRPIWFEMGHAPDDAWKEPEPEGEES